MFEVGPGWVWRSVEGDVVVEVDAVLLVGSTRRVRLGIRCILGMIPVERHWIRGFLSNGILCCESVPWQGTSLHDGPPRKQIYFSEHLIIDNTSRYPAPQSRLGKIHPSGPSCLNVVERRSAKMTLEDQTKKAWSRSCQQTEHHNRMDCRYRQN